MNALRWIAGLALTVAAAGTASAWDGILTCRFEEETGFTIEKGRLIHQRHSNVQTEVVFAGLDTATPVMKGTLGESPLRVIRRESDTVWMMEQPPLGGVNVYTVFRDTKRVIGSKQYRAASVNVTFALTWIGTCR